MIDTYIHVNGHIKKQTWELSLLYSFTEIPKRDLTISEKDTRFRGIHPSVMFTALRNWWELSDLNFPIKRILMTVYSNCGIAYHIYGLKNVIVYWDTIITVLILKFLFCNQCRRFCVIDSSQMTYTYLSILIRIISIILAERDIEGCENLPTCHLAGSGCNPIINMELPVTDGSRGRMAATASWKVANHCPLLVRHSYNYDCIRFAKIRNDSSDPSDSTMKKTPRVRHVFHSRKSEEYTLDLDRSCSRCVFS